jgi:hypothetical protein
MEKEAGNKKQSLKSIRSIPTKNKFDSKPGTVYQTQSDDFVDE